MPGAGRSPGRPSLSQPEGPQILQRFGTFRFLITELVPLQLISQQRVQDTSLDNTAAGAGTEGVPF